VGDVTAATRGHALRKALAALHPPEMMPDEMLDAEIRALMEADKESARRWDCPRPGCNGLPHPGWLHRHARASQRLPLGEWDTWLMLTGRGWGKTRTASEGVRKWVGDENAQPLHIAVVGKTDTLAKSVNFEHRKSGLLRIIPEKYHKHYNRSVGDLYLELTNGTVLRGFGANKPNNIRGFEFDKFWADEYAAWNRHTAQEVMDMLWFCLREASEPQGIISTTPQPLPHVKVLLDEWKAEQAEIAAGTKDPADERIKITRGHTTDNRANLGERALDRLGRKFNGTRQGKQELSGELLEDVEGALWKAAMFAYDGFRMSRIMLPPLDRIVVAVDPAVTSSEGADNNGFTVAARSYPFGKEHHDPRPRGYVLHSEAFQSTPYQTMRHAADLYHLWKADAVILEADNGGDYLSTVLMMVDPTVNFRIVRASRGGGNQGNGKRARATPVAGLYEQHRIHHVGEAVDFDALETVMTTYVGAVESKEKSPDILDSLVWALWDLFLDASPAAEGAVRTSDQRLQGRR
jgi:phage terminase large subunit-like protein